MASDPRRAQSSYYAAPQMYQASIQPSNQQAAQQPVYGQNSYAVSGQFQQQGFQDQNMYYQMPYMAMGNAPGMYNPFIPTPGTAYYPQATGYGSQNPANMSQYSPGSIPYMRSQQKPQQQQQAHRAKEPQIAQECVPCSKTFPNRRSYDNHVSQHEYCTKCPFNASKRLVKEHEKKEHGIQAPAEEETTFKLVKKEESPEEVQRWIEERRRNYPTAENLKRKQEEERLLKERGEFYKHQKEKKAKLRQIMNQLAELTGETAPSNTKRKREDDIMLKTIPAAVGEEGEEGELSGDENDAPEEAHIVKQDPRPDKRANLPCRYFVRGKCKQGDKCPFKHDVAAQEHQLKKSSDKDVLRQPKRRKNLMDTFSQQDAEKEMQVVFQVARFLIKNEFFEGVNVDQVLSEMAGSNGVEVPEQHLSDPEDDEDDETINVESEEESVDEIE